jgi:AcrR family transcriptional regulator
MTATELAGPGRCDVVVGQTYAEARATRCTDHRERLLGAVMQLAVRGGCDAATVREIAADAGGSRSAFYEYFTDKEDCFLQALAPIGRELLADIRDSVDSEPLESATGAATRALVAFAASRPSDARLLMSDMLAGGRRLLDARDELISQSALVLDDAFQRAPSSAIMPDISPRLLVGAICRLIACRLREREPSLAGVGEEIMEWLAGYELPVGEHRWRALASPPPPPRSPFLAPIPLRAPQELASGRQRLPEEHVSEHHWLRIVFATAEIVARDGYAATTVAEINRLAGVDGRVFYRLFAGKPQALAAARELFFRHAMAVSAGAFAAGESWPDRVWEAARAFAQSVEQSPTLASASFVESHCGGPAQMRRFEELAYAFTIFLQEGDRYEPSGADRPLSPPSPLAQQAIVASILELCYMQARARGVHLLSARLGHVMFISLAPFLGADGANAFLLQKSPAGGEDAQPSSRDRVGGHSSVLAAAG